MENRLVLTLTAMLLLVSSGALSFLIKIAVKGLKGLAVAAGMTVVVGVAGREPGSEPGRCVDGIAARLRCDRGEGIAEAADVVCVSSRKCLES